MNEPTPSEQQRSALGAGAASGDRLLMGLVLAAALVGVLGGVWGHRWQSHKRDPGRPRQLIDFTLTERSGRVITRMDLTNQFLVVNLVFTSCNLICRSVNDRMEEIQRLVLAMPDVRLVSLSVDPRTDTPALLRKFADDFHADAERWLFLTGDKDEIYRLIETSFTPKSPDPGQVIPGGFANTDRIVLMDPHGHFCASFNGLRTTTPQQVAESIARLRTEGRTP